VELEYGTLTRIQVVIQTVQTFKEDVDMYLFDGGFWCIPLTCDNLGKNTRKRLASAKNGIVFENTMARYIMDALKRYHIEGLPDTISERVLLQSLLWYGRVCIFEKDGALYGLPVAPSGAGLNIYGDYGSGFVFAANGKLNEQVRLYIHGSDDAAFLDKTNGSQPNTSLHGVMIRENALMFPFIRIVMQFAEAVSDSYRTLDVVRRNLKLPYVIAAQEELIPSIKRMFEEIETNVDKISIDTGVFDPSKISAIPLYQDGGTVLTDATQLIEWYENKFRELCGFESNAQMDKKGENLITAELSVNDQYEQFSVEKATDYIQEGLDDVNRLFGTNITVRRSEYESDMEATEGERSSGVPGGDTGSSGESD
jgi:hypothetical protein